MGNVGKRIFVIGFSIIAFGNIPSNQTLIGSAIAIAGAGLYSYLKACGGGRPRQQCVCVAVGLRRELSRALLPQVGEKGC